MSKVHCPEVLDSWLFILGQLEVDKYVQRKSILSRSGCDVHAYTLSVLKEAGLVKNASIKQDGVKGYHLCRPLNEIPFSKLVNVWSLSSIAHTRRLFLRYGHLSLADILLLPTLPTGESDTSLDGVCHVIKFLTYGTFVKRRFLRQLTGGYSYKAVRLLQCEGIIVRCATEGYTLAKPKRLITLEDITPAVSTKNNTLAKILLLAKDEPVTTLFKDD